MDEQGWKIIAIIFIVLFILAIVWIILGMIVWHQYEENTKICYYDICEEYPDALYEDGVCYCYDYDVLGNFIISKTEYMD